MFDKTRSQSEANIDSVYTVACLVYIKCAIPIAETKSYLAVDYVVSITIINLVQKLYAVNIQKSILLCFFRIVSKLKSKRFMICCGCKFQSRAIYLFFPDVISIEKTNENFRLLYDVKGRFTVHRIQKEEAKVRINAENNCLVKTDNKEKDVNAA